MNTVISKTASIIQLIISCCEPNELPSSIKIINPAKEPSPIPAIKLIVINVWYQNFITHQMGAPQKPERNFHRVQSTYDDARQKANFISAGIADVNPVFINAALILNIASNKILRLLSMLLFEIAVCDGLPNVVTPAKVKQLLILK
ncbi:MAG: hypothetical protein ACOYVG_13055 [Bacteroidota bacterium]